MAGKLVSLGDERLLRVGLRDMNIDELLGSLELVLVCVIFNNHDDHPNNYIRSDYCIGLLFAEETSTDKMVLS